MTNFADLLCWVTDKFSAVDLCKFLGLVWAMWIARNETIIKQHSPNFQVLCHGFLNLVNEYAGYASAVHPSRQPVAQTVSFGSWNLPPTGTIKINFDAAMIGDGRVGLGCVAQDDKGEVL